MGRLYARTAFESSVETVRRAACIVHDKAIGRVGSFHLFRLPVSLETSIRSVDTTKLAAKMEPALENLDGLVGTLDEIAGRTKRSASGPARLGTVKELESYSWIAATASFYAAAIRASDRVFPFWEAEDRDE